MWGKLFGGMAGFAMGGPLGAIVGAALGHAAETGAIGAMPRFETSFQFGARPRPSALPGGRDQVFSLCVVVLAAKLAKADGPVNRLEIDAFKRCFRIPEAGARDVGRLFDQARDSQESYATYAAELANTFADNPALLEDVLGSLFVIARADGALNRREEEFLETVRAAFGLGADAAGRASQGRRAGSDEEDPYEVLGVPRDAGAATLRTAWKRLMREHHPDSLASRGVQQEFIDRASEKVARINAAWDRIKRERGL
jgi:DnaJ like chaperone protein